MVIDDSIKSQMEIKVGLTVHKLFKKLITLFKINQDLIKKIKKQLTLNFNFIRIYVIIKKKINNNHIIE